MSWFKVDDGFYSHAKVLGIPRSIRAEAIGTWILAGTWAADKLTDGRIPSHMVEEIAGSLAGAEALVEARLWRRTRVGFAFVNWAEFQPTRADVEAARKAERDRKADYRARTRATTGESPASVPPGQSENPNPPIPSRPDPTPNSDPPRGADEDGSSHTGDKVVDNSLNVEHVLSELRARTGRDLERADVLYVVGKLIDRRGADAPPLKRPTSWAIRAIRNDWAECQKWIDERGAA